MKAAKKKWAHVEVHKFERKLAHPPERVFRALTDEAELAEWFPAAVDGDLRDGARLEFRERRTVAPAKRGEVQVFEPPRRLVYTWGDQTLNWELTPVPGGCLLVLTTIRAPSNDGSVPLALAA